VLCVQQVERCVFIRNVIVVAMRKRINFFGKQKLIDCLVDAMEEEHVSRDLLEKHQI